MNDRKSYSPASDTEIWHPSSQVVVHLCSSPYEFVGCSLPQDFSICLSPSGEAWEDVLRHKAQLPVGPGVGVAGVVLPNCWPATPSPHSNYKPPCFGMPPIPQECDASHAAHAANMANAANVAVGHPQEVTRTSLNINAREFVPFSRMNLQQNCHMTSDVPSRAWDEPDYPNEAPDKLRSLEICLPWEGFMSKEGLKAAPECPTKASSKGSALHGTGQCKPCAWFWKPRGCSNAVDCSYCHACPAGALKERKKAKVAAIRAGIIEPRGKVQK